ncbi:methyltransferase domain-containing protein [Acidianus infernus]|uniref:Methyltransferase domain-containing protein n=1 Tax=Acidianus infernus TaxID=12915 RepID=A0A6A9QF94_ACIIN|nr:methyltransferase domain-containing protein [Acidianus infernus]MUM65821.1 methyltransferase domain-containing protein [Acidianus infernus]
MEDRHIPPIILSFPLRRFFENPYKILTPFVRRGMTVVDHGCGPGFYTIPLSYLVGKEGIVYAVDSSAKSIKVLESKLKKKGINNVKTFVSRNLNFIPSASIDFLLSKDVLCCTVLHKELAREIERVLKPGGKALVTIRIGKRSDPRSLSAEEFFSLFTNIERKGLSRFHAWVILSGEKK